MSRCEQNGHYLSSDGHCVNCDFVNPEWRAAYLKVAGVALVTPRIRVVPDSGQNVRVEHLGGVKPETIVVLDPQEQRELASGLRQALKASATFVVLRAVGEDTQAVAVAFNRQAADTEVVEAAARDLRCFGPHPHGGGWEGCYEVVEVPIVGLKEPA